jgi:hypothetical protein
VTGAIRSSDFAQKSSQATAYCQEAMEKIRSYRDQVSWDAFETACTARNLSTFTLSSTPASGFDLRFDSCTVATLALNKEQATIILSVHWIDSTGDHKSELISNFTNWK